MNDHNETVINYLTGPVGLKVQDLIKALEIERGTFYSWRRSTSEFRRKEMANKLIELFLQHFPDGKLPQNESSKPAENDIQLKYIAMLEGHVEDLKAEVKRLKTENTEVLNYLREEIKLVKNKLTM